MVKLQLNQRRYLELFRIQLSSLHQNHSILERDNKSNLHLLPLLSYLQIALRKILMVVSQHYLNYLNQLNFCKRPIPYNHTLSHTNSPKIESDKTSKIHHYLIKYLKERCHMVLPKKQLKALLEEKQTLKVFRKYFLK